MMSDVRACTTLSPATPRSGIERTGARRGTVQLLRTRAEPERRQPGAPDRALREPLAGVGDAPENGDVPANEIDAYLDALEEPKQSTLARLRDTIMAIVPDGRL